MKYWSLQKEALLDEELQGYIRITTHPDYPELAICNYTDKTTYDKHWSKATLISRGLMLNEGNIIALSFPKFFNYHEMLPDISSTVSNKGVKEVLEKVDGSLLIVFHYRGQWHTATRGSFVSEQAIKGKELLQKQGFPKNTRITYLYEVIYPENRIVVDYGNTEEIIPLGAYSVETGEFQPPSEKSLKRYSLSVSEALSQAKTLPSSHEGYVIYLNNGLRIKIKGEEYLTMHKAIHMATPLAAWRMIKDKVDRDDLLTHMPEEYSENFEALLDYYELTWQNILIRLEELVEEANDLSDKELGLILQSKAIGNPVQRYIFPARKNPKFWEEIKQVGSKYRERIFKLFRPDGNVNPLTQTENVVSSR